MKLQVGSSVARGVYKESGWVNLDMIPAKGVDIVADASERIPLEDSSVDEIHCIHVLEHVTRDKYSKMLAEMYRVLKPGGLLYVEVPDFQGTVKKLTKAFESGDVQAIHVWTTSTYGKNERKGMAHHWGFYEGLLCKAFSDQGFIEVTRITSRENMISTHYKKEPILLVVGQK